jgi:outer membrane protein assembly factor BamB
MRARASLYQGHGRRSAVTITIITATAILVAPLASRAAAGPGSRLWTHRYDGPASGDDSASRVALTSDGSTGIVTGGSEGSTTDKDYATRAYDASTGGTLWTAIFDGPAHFADDATGIAISPDDSTVFVTGESSATTNVNDYDYATIAYDIATGGELWVKRYNGPAHSNDVAFAMTVSPSGQRVFVTGTSISTSGSFDFATLAYDATTGTKLWKVRYGGRSNGIDEPNAIISSPDGASVFVTGLSWSRNNSYDMKTIAYDADTGDTLWSQRFDGPAHDFDYANALAISPDGSQLFVTGTTTGGARDYTTIAYDAASAAIVWSQRWDSHTGDDVGQTITVSPDGARVFVAGFGPTVAYDAATGTELWNKAYSGFVNGQAIVSTPDGSTVIVAGDYFPSTGGTDIGTLALDATTGAKVWGRHANGPGNGQDSLRSAAMAPDGASVFVAGYSTGKTSGSDYLTIAYDLG